MLTVTPKNVYDAHVASKEGDTDFIETNMIPVTWSLDVVTDNKILEGCKRIVRAWLHMDVHNFCKPVDHSDEIDDVIDLTQRFDGNGKLKCQRKLFDGEFEKDGDDDEGSEASVWDWTK